MMNLVENFATTSSKRKIRYSLDEILVIMFLKNKDNKMSDEKIAEIINHPKDSVSYKSRWIVKFIKTNGENTIPNLFKYFEIEFKGAEDVEERIRNFLERSVKQAV